MRVRLLIVRVIGCAAVLASGCKTKLDTKDLEATLRERMVNQGLSSASVTCPPEVEAELGKAFVCQVAVDATHRYALNVTQGAVNHATGKIDLDTAWRDGEAIQTAKLAAVLTTDLRKQFAADVVITCGDEPLRFLDAQRKLTCALSLGETKSVATIDFNAALAPTDWHLSPALLSRTMLEKILLPSVRGKTTADASVDCGPGALRVRPADGTLWCTISTAGRTAKIKVDVDDQLNVQSWNVAEPPG